ncbi:MAG: hypothetical protein RBU37_26410 [Myxococcota bacterium]|nr:hypothetical protein [Myxococcota bacterium]
MGESGQAPNRQEVGESGQAPNRQEVGESGQAPNRQEVLSWAESAHPEWENGNSAKQSFAVKHGSLWREL